MDKPLILPFFMEEYLCLRFIVVVVVLTKLVEENITDGYMEKVRSSARTVDGNSNRKESCSYACLLLLWLQGKTRRNLL